MAVTDRGRDNALVLASSLFARVGACLSPVHLPRGAIPPSPPPRLVRRRVRPVDTAQPQRLSDPPAPTSAAQPCSPAYCTRSRSPWAPAPSPTAGGVAGCGLVKAGWRAPCRHRSVRPRPRRARRGAARPGLSVLRESMRVGAGCADTSMADTAWDMAAAAPTAARGGWRPPAHAPVNVSTGLQASGHGLKSDAWQQRMIIRRPYGM